MRKALIRLTNLLTYILVIRMGKKVNATTMLELETFQKLTELSRETGKSISALIREAVRQWLKGKS